MKNRPIMGVLAQPMVKPLVTPRKIGVVDEYITQDLVEHLTSRQRLGHGTIVTRASRIRVFMRWLIDNPAPLSSETIEKFFFFLRTEKQLSGTSCNTYIAALLSYHKYLKDRGDSEDFMKGFKLFREVDPDIIALTPQEIHLIKTQCLLLSKGKKEKHYARLTLFLIDTGVRWADSRIIRVRNVDITSQEISFIQHKTGRRMVIHIEDPLLSILRFQCHDSDGEKLLFRNNFDNAIHYPEYARFIKKLAKEVGITKRISPHIFRHSYGQNSYDATRDILLTKDLLGHSNIRSTMRYVHNSKARLMEAQIQHPHLSGSLKPQRRIDLAKKTLIALGLENDKNFNSDKVREAIDHFAFELSQAGI